MKNANVFVDVDLTLVDANGKLLSGAREALLSDAADAGGAASLPAAAHNWRLI